MSDRCSTLTLTRQNARIRQSITMLALSNAEHWDASGPLQLCGGERATRLSLALVGSQ